MPMNCAAGSRPCAMRCADTATSYLRRVYVSIRPTLTYTVRVRTPIEGELDAGDTAAAPGVGVPPQRVRAVAVHAHALVVPRHSDRAVHAQLLDHVLRRVPPCLRGSRLRVDVRRQRLQPHHDQHASCDGGACWGRGLTVFAKMSGLQQMNPKSRHRPHSPRQVAAMYAGVPDRSQTGRAMRTTKVLWSQSAAPNNENASFTVGCFQSRPRPARCCAIAWSEQGPPPCCRGGGTSCVSHRR